jgi:orotidine 5'-phosphate decarboxylase subfamily 1
MKHNRLSYAARADSAKNSLAKKLLHLIEMKKTNLAVSADVTTAKELLELAEMLGPEICIFKTHIDIIEDFTPALTQALGRLAIKHDFLIFEDRKFADIGNTVKEQYNGGIYRIGDWAHIINAHALPGPGVIAGLSESGIPNQCGLLLLAEMSSAGNFLGENYVKKTLMLAEQFPEFVFGFIAQHKISENENWLTLTPGVQLATTQDALGQRYVTPEMAIQRGSDVIIVGRGILTAPDKLETAKTYRAAAWNAYLQALTISATVDSHV